MSKDKNSRQAPIRLTERDLGILQKLNAAGWLTTEQIQKYFFPGKSANAVSKRLRKLVVARYLAMARISSTESGLYRLAGQGKLALIEHSSLSEKEITIPNQLPRKVKHFIAINDLRYCFERLLEGSDVQLLFFFSERELNLYCQNSRTVSDPVISLLTIYRIVPDAIARIRITDQETPRTLDVALEYDSGTEHATFFARTKVKQYTSLIAQNHERVGDFKVLTFTESVKRIISLMRQAVGYQPPHHMFYFALMEKLTEVGWEAKEVFLDPYDFFLPMRRGSELEIIEKEIEGENIPKHSLVTLPATSPCRASLREERFG